MSLVERRASVVRSRSLSRAAGYSSTAAAAVASPPPAASTPSAPRATPPYAYATPMRPYGGVTGGATSESLRPSGSSFGRARALAISSGTNFPSSLRSSSASRVSSSLANGSTVKRSASPGPSVRRPDMSMYGYTSESVATPPRRSLVSSPPHSSLRAHPTSGGVARPALAVASLASRSGQPLRAFSTTTSSSFGSASGPPSSTGASPAGPRRVTVTRTLQDSPVSSPTPAVVRAPSLPLAPADGDSATNSASRRGSFSRTTVASNDPASHAPSSSSSSNAIQSAYASAMAQAEAQSQTHAAYAYPLTPGRPLPPPSQPSFSPYSSGTFTTTAASPPTVVRVPSFTSTSSQHTGYQLAPVSPSAASTASHRVASISNHFASSPAPSSMRPSSASLALAAAEQRLSARGMHGVAAHSTAASAGAVAVAPPVGATSPVSSSSSSSSFSYPLPTSSRRRSVSLSHSMARGGSFDENALSEDEDDAAHTARRQSLSRPMPSITYAHQNGTNSSIIGGGGGGGNIVGSGAHNDGALVAGSSTRRMRNLVGLANMGNTCFLNSTLQCLLSTPGLLEYFATSRYESDINVRGARTKGSLARAFGALASRMVSARDGAIERPASVKSAVSIIDAKFLGFGQHDAHEFTRVLLAALHDDVNRVRIKPAYEEIKDGPTDSDAVKADRWWRNHTERNESIVTDCFAGQMQSTLVCQTCRNQSEAFDPFMDLSLPIPKSGGGGVTSQLSRMSLFSGGGGSVSRYTLHDCFGEFLSEELLSGHEQVYCRSCKTHRDQTKKLRIYRWPRILVLHLKRFSYGSHSRAKLNTDVEFPTELDCTRMHTSDEARKEPPAIYDLYGVSNHMGSAGGGHYTAHCKVVDGVSAPFYTFNDSSVYPIATTAIKGPAAYVLFYRRRG